MRTLQQKEDRDSPGTSATEDSLNTVEPGSWLATRATLGWGGSVRWHHKAYVGCDRAGTPERQTDLTREGTP